MQRDEFPDRTYTETWSKGRGEVRFFTRPDGSRLRYFTAGNGPPLVLMHTVRTQLDYFQRVIPRVWDHYTVYAVDLPGMRWSDIVPGYPEVSAPVTLVYSDGDWSRPAERARVAGALARVQRIALPHTGHFSSWERPDDVARILLGAVASWPRLTPADRSP
jgi:pimeloyl-ACP methyl ester carboxylesterase